MNNPIAIDACPENEIPKYYNVLRTWKSVTGHLSQIKRIRNQNCTSSGIRCKPNLNCLFNAIKFSLISSIELLSVKLKKISGISPKWEFCSGINVRPPGNFKISNEKGCPKVVLLRVKLASSRYNATRVDFSKLKTTGSIETLSRGGRTPNTTSVQLEPPGWCMDKIATYWKTNKLLAVSPLYTENIHFDNMKQLEETFEGGTPISPSISSSNSEMWGISSEAGFCSLKYACAVAENERKYHQFSNHDNSLLTIYQIFSKISNPTQEPSVAIGSSLIFTKKRGKRTLLNELSAKNFAWFNYITAFSTQYIQFLSRSKT